MFDGKTMNKAYLCPDKTAVAIPGGCHPVVASPVSDCIYIWGLGGVEGSLGARDLKDFAYLKKVGDFLKELRISNGNMYSFTVQRSYLDKFCENNGINDHQKTNIEQILAEYGVTFQDCE